MTISERMYRILSAVVLALFVLLAGTVSLRLPIFEGIDEIEHFRVMDYLIHNRRLPDPNERTMSEYHQPPLYYALGALVVMVTGDEDFAAREADVNVYHPYLLTVRGTDNKNVFLHSRAEWFPYSASPTALAFHILR